MTDTSTDLYLKKTILFEIDKNKFSFDVAQDLFSSNVIDFGTQRLLRTLLTSNIGNFDKILDLGCGYGPIGIILKKLNPESVVHMIDIDALALDYSNHNAKLNGVEDIKIYGSLGYENVKSKDFDLIVSNIPAKVGKQALSHMILDARFHLKSDGLVAVVVIDAIVDYVRDILKSNEHVKIIFEKSWPGHTVLHYRFIGNFSNLSDNQLSGVEVYDRTQNDLIINKHTASVVTTYNLPEFDTLNFETQLLLDNLLHTLQFHPLDVAVFNPGQGYIPVAISKITVLNKLILIDRNLQALEISKRNLLLNNFSLDKISLFHQTGIKLTENDKVDCLIGVVPEKQNDMVYRTIANQLYLDLHPTAISLLVSSSSVISRIEKYIHEANNLTVVLSKKSKGKRVITLKIKNK